MDHPISTAYHLTQQTGMGLCLPRGALLRVSAPEGHQVADLMAVSQHNTTAWLSNGRTFDYAEQIYLTTGHTLYSNHGTPMLTIKGDDGGRHDFLFAACSQAMFARQYGIQTPHPNCQDNLLAGLAAYGTQGPLLTTPFNIFMHVDVLPTGQLQIHPPQAAPGATITFRAEMDLVV
ncbi:MAG TPA: urea carboxylase-associated family protein, partial [Herpetosiphonaceae bacterium]|nr:urea carboxylase-associated family protein [Herpetosiphonaceae bacterium]